MSDIAILSRDDKKETAKVPLVSDGNRKKVTLTEPQMPDSFCDNLRAAS